ncbi:unnamed protein product [Linum tenue]|uniref:Uncharacterized protein n=1 Tax=Linum tenue TaxID=586396 RepID=A0AAV0RN53_9ROSI|nr:unnamed protein product [Linum tenue]
MEDSERPKHVTGADEIQAGEIPDGGVSDVRGNEGGEWNACLRST